MSKNKKKVVNEEQEEKEFNQKKDIKNKRFSKAFGHALDGVIGAFKTERNLRIDYFIGLVVLITSLFFEFSKQEFACLCLTIGFVIFAEMINSTVEYVVDLITDKYDKRAKAAKDIAAGGVLISSLVAVINAYFLFADKIYGAANSVLWTILDSKIYILFTILFATLILGIILKGMFGKRNENGDYEYAVAFPNIKVALAFAITTYSFLITKSIFVVAMTFILSIMIVKTNLDYGKAPHIYSLMSALIGILIVLIIYQIVLNKGLILNLFV